jgi:hypothetical protein
MWALNAMPKQIPITFTFFVFSRRLHRCLWRGGPDDRVLNYGVPTSEIDASQPINDRAVVDLRPSLLPFVRIAFVFLVPGHGRRAVGSANAPRACHV